MRASETGERRLAMQDFIPVRSILVATDLSAQEGIAVQRAWRLAQAHGAALRLMYMPPRGQEPVPDAARRLARAARDLEDGLRLRATAVPVNAHALDDLLAASRGMDLVVLPHRRERSTGAFFRGQPVLPLLRAARCPVLVARHADQPHYRRILVALGFAAESLPLAELAAGIDPRAELELFHAVDTANESRLRFAEATENAVRAYRRRCLEHARRRMLALADAFEARHRRVLTAFGRGDAGHQVVLQQEHSGADLVVVGKRRSTAWDDFFSGSVAHRVLSWGRSDVLVVPLGLTPATAPMAARRIGAIRPSSTWAGPGAGAS